MNGRATVMTTFKSLICGLHVMTQQSSESPQMRGWSSKTNEKKMSRMFERRETLLKGARAGKSSNENENHRDVRPSPNSHSSIIFLYSSSIQF